MSCRAISIVVVLFFLVGCGGATVGHAPEGDSPSPWGGGEAGSVLAGDGSPDEPSPIVEVAWGPERGPAGPLVVHTDPGDLPELRIAGEEQRLPLDHTHVKAHLAGFVASVEVAQTFENPHAEPIEVVYVFPLPENSAVSAMQMRIGERVVEAKIAERRAARRIYQRAKRRGQTAALLEQERPNVFTQSVANIAPGERIDVVVRYVQDLTYDAGRYEFVFPMVVGPRFIPGTPLAAAMKGTGTYQDTDRVPDASRITPPVLGKGERSGHDISVEVTAENALPVDGWEVPTHEVVAHRPADGSLRLTLAERESLPNRDFVLRYDVAGTEPRATLLTSGEEEDGYFALLIHPPRLDVDELVGARELIFVLDVSGSMKGVPLGMCKRAMRQALSRLRPVDTFNIVTFAGTSRKAFPSPRPANRTHLDEAMRFVGAARAGGGTHMAEGVRAALRPDVPAGRHRYVFFLTDGYVGNEAEIIAGSRGLVEAIEGRGQRARVFALGVGSSVNRHLLEGLSEAGKGVAVYATRREDPALAVDHFFGFIDRPVLTKVRIDWADAMNAELYPRPIPDLFASHPIVVHGRYRQLSEAPLVVRADLGEREIRLPVRLRRSAIPGPRGGLVGRLWARAKIGFLEEESWLGMVPDAAERITRLGLDHELVTPYTSFVAVDEARIGQGDPRTIVQPVETPEGVNRQAAGGRRRAPTSTLAPPGAGPIAAQPRPSEESERYGWEDDRLEGVADQPGQAPMGAAPEPMEDAEDDAPPDMALGPPEAGRSARGCACRLPASGGSGASDRWLLLAGLFALSALRRRRTATSFRRPRSRRGSGARGRS